MTRLPLLRANLVAELGAWDVVRRLLLELAAMKGRASGMLLEPAVQATNVADKKSIRTLRKSRTLYARVQLLHSHCVAAESNWFRSTRLRQLGDRFLGDRPWFRRANGLYAKVAELKEEEEVLRAEANSRR